MGVQRVPGLLGLTVLGGLGNFTPGVAKLVLAQAQESEQGTTIVDATERALEETAEDIEAAKALLNGAHAGQEITFLAWAPGDTDTPTRSHTTRLYASPDEAAAAALAATFADSVNNRAEYGGLIYKVAGKQLYVAGPAVTSHDAARLDQADMGIGKGTWRRGELPGLKTVSDYHTHIRGDAHLAEGVTSKAYAGFVPPAQKDLVDALRKRLRDGTITAQGISDEAFKTDTELKGDVGHAVTLKLDGYIMDRNADMYFFRWRTLATDKLVRPTKLRTNTKPAAAPPKPVPVAPLR